MVCDWMLPDMILMVSLCDPACLTCFGQLITQCNSCDNDTSANIEYMLLNKTCVSPCPIPYFRSAPNVCGKCATNCTVCSVVSTNCTVCASGYVYLPLDNTCPTSCPSLYYFDSSTNQCELCNTNCTVCTGNPGPCQRCISTLYLYSQACYDVCPSADLVANPVNATCENCSTWCVGLTLTFYQPSGSNGISNLYIDLNFTHALDFSTFPMTTFQTITFANSSLTLDMFTITYTQTNSNRGYRITLQPIGYSLVINQTITVTTLSLPSPKHNSSDGRLFKDTNY